MWQRLKHLLSGNSTKAKVSRGILWLFLGTVLSKGLMLASMLIIARLMSVVDYGALGILRNFIATFSLFALMSFGVTTTKYLSIYAHRKPHRANRILALTQLFVIASSIFISGLIFILATFVSEKILNNPQLVQHVHLASLIIFFTAINGYQQGILAGLEDFKKISIINAINGFLHLPILFFLTPNFGLIGAVWGLLLIAGTTWLISFKYVYTSLKQNNIKPTYSTAITECGILKKFTLPSFISGLAIAPSIFIVSALLAHQPNGYYELGLFSAAYFISVFSNTVNRIIGQALYPFVMRQNENTRQLEFANTMLPWLIGIFINLPFIIFPEILGLALGDKYHSEELYLSVMITATFSIIVAHRQGIARKFAAKNLMWWSVLGNYFWAIALISASWLHAQQGAIAILLAFLFAFSINTIVFIPFYLHQKLIPKYLLISTPSTLIWLVIILSISTRYFEMTITAKIFVFIFALLAVYYLSYELWKNYSQK